MTKFSLSMVSLDGTGSVALNQAEKNQLNPTSDKRVLDSVLEVVCYCVKLQSEELHLKICKVVVY